MSTKAKLAKYKKGYDDIAMKFSKWKKEWLEREKWVKMRIWMYGWISSDSGNWGPMRYLWTDVKHCSFSWEEAVCIEIVLRPKAIKKTWIRIAKIGKERFQLGTSGLMVLGHQACLNAFHKSNNRKSDRKQVLRIIGVIVVCNLPHFFYYI